MSRYCELLALKRNLNVEIAMTAGMLHDIANVNGESDNHALEGSKQAEVFLKNINLYNDEEIRLIVNAISKHSSKHEIDDPYDELLKYGDVLSHCFYNPYIQISDLEAERYKIMLNELGCNNT